MTDDPLARLLPPLREDLRVFEAASEADGAPAWVIEDPVVNRFYRIGWLEFECLLRWRGDARAVAGEIAGSTPLQPDPEQVAALAGFLEQHQLVRPGLAAIDRLAARSAASPWRQWRWWLHNYLFFRIPLVRPQTFLAATARYLGGLFQPATLWLLGALSAVGLLLVFRQWDPFSRAVVESISPQGLLGFAAALILAKTLHELGLAGLATLGWALTGPGWVNTACLYLATTSWVLSLALNASPFMRFDGYFILSDLLDFPNLHERSSALARVALRRTLLGLAEPWPEAFPLRERRLLVAFAYVTWLYRLVVFLGIAVAVYLFFFKLLGIFLFAVELVWFIGLPVWREIKVWLARRAEAPSGRRRLLGALALVFLLLLAIPWKSGIDAPGVARAERQNPVFAPYPAVLVALHPDGPVAAGALLAQLDAPDLRAQGSRNEARAAALVSQLTGLHAQSQGLEQASATAGRLGEQLAEVQATGEELGRLQLKAPFAGVWRDVDPQRQPGSWLNTREALGILVDPQGWQVDAYVTQDDVERLRPGAAASFLPDNALRSIDARVIDIDTTPASRLSQPMLANRHGGPIAVTERAQDLQPAAPRFRVRLQLDEPPPQLHETRGRARIEGERRSLLGAAVRDMLAVLVRESGF